MLIVNGSFRSERLLRWRAFQQGHSLSFANRHCSYSLTSCQSASFVSYQSPLHVTTPSLLHRCGRISRGNLLLCHHRATSASLTFTAFNHHCSERQEIPEVIHAAYCFLSCSQRSFHRPAPTLPFSFF